MFFRLVVCIIFTTFIEVSSEAVASTKDCHYSTWTWDTFQKLAVNHSTVQKSKSKLLKYERDRFSPCTLCREDQQLVSIPGISPFLMCKHFAEQVRSAILSALKLGFPIYEVVGYRVGRSKGKVDSNGLRTEYSNHSFGTAIDINPNFNGLYDNCTHFSPSCRLLRGGLWKSENPASIKTSSSIYKEFQRIGWRWGGSLEGKQKDFMHFSLTGD
ncbi:MAG: M15 family metallopeptidase [Bdellovibrionota bacterium]